MKVGYERLRWHGHLGNLFMRLNDTFWTFSGLKLDVPFSSYMHVCTILRFGGFDNTWLMIHC